MNPVELYEQLPPERQKLLDEVNFLAQHLNADLMLEQFYLALEALNHRLQTLLPETQCATGCSQCCQHYALPEVLPIEWALIQQALATLSSQQMQQIQANVTSARDLLDDDLNLKAPRHRHADVSCPLLIDGKCSVYAYRPFDCRVTGYSFSQSRERPLPMLGLKLAPYSCQSEQVRVLQNLEQGQHALEYMFVPNREQLWQSFKAIELSGENPRRLVSLLTKYFQEPELLPV